MLIDGIIFMHTSETKKQGIGIYILSILYLALIIVLRTMHFHLRVATLNYYLIQ